MNNLFDQQVAIPVGNRKLHAALTIPGNAEAIIIFCRAAAEDRFNARDRLVAVQLQEAGFGTLLPDLLFEDEMLKAKEFDVELLTMRLLMVTKWLMQRDLFNHYRIGYYGIAVGAAAAIEAAACLKESIGAIVSAGGRPELALTAIPELQSPTLMIVGSLDHYVVELHRQVLEEFSCIRKLTIVQGATHLFLNDKIGEVAGLTREWYRQYLQRAPVVLRH